MTTFRNWLLAAARSPAVLLLALTVVFFADVLFVPDRVLLIRDTISNRIFVYVFDWLKHGELPLWSTVGCGKPLAGEPFYFVFYPLTVLHFLLELPAALSWFNALSFYLTGLGIYVLARQFGAGKTASLLGAVSVMFGTWMMAYLEYQISMATAPWMFWVAAVLVRFYQNERDADGGVWRRIWRQRLCLAALTVLMALHFMANYYEFFVYSYVGYALLVMVIGILARNWRLWLALVGCSALAGALAVLLILPKLGLVAEFLPFTERAAGTFDTRFDMASLGVGHLLQAALPMVGGRAGYPNVYWAAGTYEFWAGTFYVGAAALLALPLAFTGWRRQSPGLKMAALWGALLVTLGWLLAMGVNTPLYGWFHDYVPLMERFRFASKFLLLVTFGGAALAAVGFQRLLVMEEREARRLLWVEGAALALLGLLVLWLVGDPLNMVLLYRADTRGIPLENAEAMMPSVVWSYVFLLAAYGWMWWTVRSRCRWAGAAGVALVFINLLVVSRPTQMAGDGAYLNKTPSAVTRFANPNYRVFTYYQEVNQYLYGDPRSDIYAWSAEAGNNENWFAYPDFNLMHQGGTKMQKYNILSSTFYGKDEKVRNNFLDIASVRVIAGGAPWQQILWGGADRTVHFQERPTAIPRFSLATAWQAAANDQAALRLIAVGDNLRGRPVLEPAALWQGRETERTLPPSPSAGGEAGKVDIVRETPSCAEVKISAAAPQVLIVSDTWYPGWRVRIDGVEAPIYRANYMFRGVFVPAGEHTVRFDYWPTHFTLYCAVAALGWLIVSGLWFSGWRKRRGTVADSQRYGE